MTRVLIAYASEEGHTARIAERMAKALRHAGAIVRLVDVRTPPAGLDVSEHDGAILGGSVHRGDHAQVLRHFIVKHRAGLEARPSLFFSVSLAAAMDDPESQAEANGYVEALIKATAWHPDEVELLPGALVYTQYGTFTRILMKLIAKQAGGPTDTSRDHVFTDWAQVDRIAEAFLATVEAAGRPPAPGLDEAVGETEAEV